MVKRIYFFRGPVCFEYDPRPGADRVVKGPTALNSRFSGVNATFSAGIDAAVNSGDGFVYLFRGSEYYKYDALSSQTTDANPRSIADGWKTFPAAFAAGIDAAFNAGNGKAYFFSGDQYLRYDIAQDRVDDPDPGTAAYPRAISDPNGWHGLTAPFQAGLDAAVNAGDGKLYFFKGGEYARLTYASRSVDAITPPYPHTISPAWDVIPSPLDCAVEWIQAGSATLQIKQGQCQQVPEASGVISESQVFVMVAQFASTGYPSLCGTAEYRQLVRGEMTQNGVDRTPPLANPSGGPPVKMLPRPSDPASTLNFQEDGRVGATVPFYGHRSAPTDPRGTYSQGDQRSGCRYQANDFPFLQGFPGDLIDIDVDFRGLIVDVAAGDEIIAEQRWTVRCVGTVR